MAPGSDEQALVALWTWLARAAQYGIEHQACQAAATRAFEAMTAAITARPIEVGVLAGDLTLGGASVQNQLLKGRLGPYLYARGVLGLRFGRGLGADELRDFVAVTARAPEEIFDGGGLRTQLADRGVTHVSVEALSYELTEEQRTEDERQRGLRRFFARLLGQEADEEAARGDRFLELLGEPRLVARMIETAEWAKDAAGVVARLVLRAAAEEAAGQAGVRARVLEVVRVLAPDVRAGLLVGLPGLPDAERAALGRLLVEQPDDELAVLLLPALRAHLEDLDGCFAPLAVLLSDPGRRLGVVRRLGRRLFDLPLEDPRERQRLVDAARPGPDEDPWRAERATLQSAIALLRAERIPFLAPAGPRATLDAAELAPVHVAALDCSVAERLTVLYTRATTFAREATGLAELAAHLLETGRPSAGLGIAAALARAEGAARAPAEQALGRLFASEALHAILDEIGCHDEAGVLALQPLMVSIARGRPNALLMLLERCESRKLRGLLIEALAEVGPPLLPRVRERLTAPQWFVVRNMVVLHGRLGGPPRELEVIMHHPRVQVRKEVIRALRAQAPDAEALELLARYLRDQAEEVRLLALGSLGGLELDADLVSEIVEEGLGERATPPVRKAALELLARAPSDAAAEALFELLEPKAMLERPAQTALREEAARALRASPAPAAAALFARGLESPKRAVRRVCERAGERDDG